METQIQSIFLESGIEISSIQAEKISQYLNTNGIDELDTDDFIRHIACIYELLSSAV
ncbi:hypothetical protein HLB25_21380 [Dickeya dadantii]|uniref:hypothetical protein n=1 Tax=Dickeya dadantii TaxID=204038 RepID=UPI0014958890|nr:hypothetical protein [Dickeya dadantii]NPE57109.1 hypothetical protein [Dickeya dadantii]NPE69061.1 hypothetical protein [Dickeya dadantii]